MTRSERSAQRNHALTLWRCACSTTSEDRIQILAALAASGRWVKIYYGWRPNLPDPGDDYLIELAVAGGARAVVTHNVRDLRRAELRWPDCAVLTPSECLEEFP